LQAYGRSSFGTGKVDVSDAFALHELNGRSISNAVRVCVRACVRA
jgi:hypothetical protein